MKINFLNLLGIKTEGDSQMDSYGCIETMGLLTAIEAADAALKAANVKLMNCYVVKGGIVTIEISGDVAAVTAAVDAGSESAKRLGNFLSKNVIARMDNETKKILTGDTFTSNNNSSNSVEATEAELLLEEMSELENLSELDELEGILSGETPTAEGDIPIYDEVIKSSEFSELENDDEVKIITEVVKRTDSDGESHASQERVLISTKEIVEEENKDYQDMKVTELRILVKNLKTSHNWNQIKGMNKKKLIEILKKKN